MKTCPSCKAQSEPGARFCLECGHPFSDAPDTTPEDPWLGRMVAGRFRIVEKLGDGGMGEVFRAEQLPMGRMVALKVLRHHLSDDPHQVERFKREAQAASQLKHPNTIIIHDFGQDDDGTLFIAMELLEGEALADAMEVGALEPQRAARILAQVCLSLEEAHGQGVVHRDLKPENIYLTERGGVGDFVKVLDFGIAKVKQGSDGGKLDTITRDGAIFGTPQYMSPEQIRGEMLDPRADVYALGVILYQAICGRLPFAATTVVEMLTKHLSAQPDPIEESADPTVARLEGIALRALSKDPDHRQASAHAFLADLAAAVPQATLHSLTGLVPIAQPATGPMTPAPVRRVENVPVLPPTQALEAPEPDIHDDELIAKSGGGIWIVLLLLLVGGGGFAAWHFFGQGDGMGTRDASVAAIAKDAGILGNTVSDSAVAVAGDAATTAANVRDAGSKADVAADATVASDAQGKTPHLDAAPVFKARPDAAKPVVDAAPKPSVDANTNAATTLAARKAAEKARAEARRQAEAEVEAKRKAAAARADAERIRAEIARQKAEAEAKKKADAAKKRNRPPRSKYGSIRIKASDGARVTMDGRLRGRTPMTLTGLKPGQYTIKLKLGEKTETRLVTVRPGKKHILKFGL